MEPWQKLVQELVEIWVEEDIKAGKFDDAKPEEKPESEVEHDSEQQRKAA